MAELQRFIDDLCAESDSLDALVADLPDSRWADPTPAEGWTIAHQIAHLPWTDEAALLAVTDPDGFTAQLTVAASQPGRLRRAGADGARPAPRRPARRLARGPGPTRGGPPGGAAGQKILWFGPPMSAASMATARLMETWAHGQDVADALGAARTPTAPAAARRPPRCPHPRLRLRRRTNSPPPAEEFRVELTAPDGVPSGRGVPRTPRSASPGPALDFCLLVTQRAQPRRPRRSTATGAGRGRWLDIAQAFAGPPGTAAVEARDTAMSRADRQLLRLLRRPVRRRCARCSTAASSTCSPATTSPS